MKKQEKKEKRKEQERNEEVVEEEEKRESNKIIIINYYKKVKLTAPPPNIIILADSHRPTFSTLSRELLLHLLDPTSTLLHRIYKLHAAVNFLGNFTGALCGTCAASPSPASRSAYQQPTRSVPRPRDKPRLHYLRKSDASLCKTRHPWIRSNIGQPALLLNPV